MKKRISKDKRLSAANNMPPLYKKQPNEKYDYKTDEVLQWIAIHPELLNYLFDKLSLGGYIVYNQSTGKWQGADYDGD